MARSRPLFGVLRCDYAKAHRGVWFASLLQYPQRSLANRRLDAIIRDVAELLDQAERTVLRQAGNATGA